MGFSRCTPYGLAVSWVAERYFGEEFALDGYERVQPAASQLAGRQPHRSQQLSRWMPWTQQTACDMRAPPSDQLPCSLRQHAAGPI
jgi:hypothetical protein